MIVSEEIYQGLGNEMRQAIDAKNDDLAQHIINKMNQFVKGEATKDKIIARMAFRKGYQR